MLQRFMAKVHVPSNPNGCWEWQEYIDKRGYGTVRAWGKKRLAHRVAYQLFNHEPTQHVLHRCDNPRCVNPAHLYEGTQKQNVREMWDRGRAVGGSGINKRKVQCKNGRVYTEENTLTYNGKRQCKECRRKYIKEYRRGLRVCKRS